MWKSRGFTLIELIIAVGLAAILSAAVVSLLSRNSQFYARDSRREADLQKFASALEVYRTDNGTYPGTNEWPGALTGGGYLNVGPTDPAGGARVYSYRAYYFNAAGTAVVCNLATTRCPGFAVCAAGEKGTPTPASTGYPACGSCGSTCTIKVTNP